MGKMESINCNIQHNAWHAKMLQLIQMHSAYDSLAPWSFEFLETDDAKHKFVYLVLTHIKKYITRIRESYIT